MTGQDVVDIARSSLWVTIQVVSPLLLVALVVGVGVSLFQALTQVQEITLTFIPKILSILVILFFLLPVYGDIFQSFSQMLFDRIVTISAHDP